VRGRESLTSGQLGKGNYVVGRGPKNAFAVFAYLLQYFCIGFALK